MTKIILGAFGLGGHEMIILYILLCILVGLAGIGKNVGFWGVFLISLLLTPLIGIIVAVASSPRNSGAQHIHYHQQAPPQQHGYDKYAHLERLADLRNRGVITEEE